MTSVLDEWPISETINLFICKFIYFEVELKPCHHVVSYALRNATAPHCVTVASVSGGSNVGGN